MASNSHNLLYTLKKAPPNPPKKKKNFKWEIWVIVSNLSVVKIIPRKPKNLGNLPLTRWPTKETQKKKNGGENSHKQTREPFFQATCKPKSRPHSTGKTSQKSRVGRCGPPRRSSLHLMQTPAHRQAPYAWLTGNWQSIPRWETCLSQPVLQNPNPKLPL